MAGVKASKQILRKEIKMRLTGLTDEEKSRQSGVVAKKLFAMSQWQSSRRVSLYLNMNDEIKTDGILKTALEANKLCFIPRYVGSCMEMLRLHSWDDYLSLPETSWKIKQPPADDNTRENATNTDGLDLVLVPGLGFSRQGHRLGRGKGYYDTFLTSYREKFGRLPVTVGLAFKEQICDQIPTAEYDVSLDFVLYDNEEST